MKYEHTREYLVPVLVELTYEDLRNIHKMAKHFLASETMPEGMYKGEMRRLERETRESLNRVSDVMGGGYSFPKFEE